GYCAGGIVAYEMARQLVEAGHTINMLALFEVYTPEGVVAKTSIKYIREKLNYLTNKLGAASGSEKIQILFREIRKVFKKATASPEDNYIIKPYSGHITLFKAREGMVGAIKDR